VKGADSDRATGNYVEKIYGYMDNENARSYKCVGVGV